MKKVLCASFLVCSVLWAGKADLAADVVKALDKIDACFSTLPAEYSQNMSFAKQIFPKGFDSQKVQNLCTEEEIQMFRGLTQCMSDVVCQFVSEFNNYIATARPERDLFDFNKLPSMDINKCTPAQPKVLSSNCQQAFQ